MPKLDDLLKRLGVSEDVITAFEADELPENADDLITTAKTGLIAGLKTTADYKAAVKSETDAQYKRAIIKHIKEYNREHDLGYTDAQISAFKDFAEFLADAKEKHTPTPSGDETLKEQIKQLQARNKEVMKERDDYADKVAAAETAKEEAVKAATEQLQAETYYMGLVQSDAELNALDLPGKSKHLENLKKELFATVKISPDGTITKPDGNPFELSGKMVTKVDDLYKHLKNEYGLIKRSNAGTGKPAEPGAGAGGAGGKALEDTPEMQHMMKNLETAYRP